MTETTEKLAPGTRAVVLDTGGDGKVRYCNAEFVSPCDWLVPGAEVIVLSGPDDQGDYDVQEVRKDGSTAHNYVHETYLAPAQPEKVDVEGYPLPTLTGVLTHETSRQYAHNAISRVNPPWVNAVLESAKYGDEFDVVEFSHALSYAFSSAARLRQGRGTACKELRHLAHWAHAKIEAAVKGLPPVEPGARSPRMISAPAIPLDT